MHFTIKHNLTQYFVDVCTGPAFCALEEAWEHEAYVIGPIYIEGKGFKNTKVTWYLLFLFKSDKFLGFPLSYSCFSTSHKLEHSSC